MLYLLLFNYCTHLLRFFFPSSLFNILGLRIRLLLNFLRDSIELLLTDLTLLVRYLHRILFFGLIHQKFFLQSLQIFRLEFFHEFAQLILLTLILHMLIFDQYLVLTELFSYSNTRSLDQ